MKYFKEDGQWMKGNLHLHSTCSDGDKSISELAVIYREKGYDFIAITDHGIVSEVPDDIDGIMIIRGCEVGVELTHSVGVGMTEVPDKEIKEEKDILCIREKAGFSFLCHPYWSNLDLSHFKMLKDFSAVEVWNTGCELEISRSFSEYPWDNALSAGIKMNAVAVDDSHQYIDDYCKAWVNVKVKERTESAIIDSLNKGEYYSSIGPSIENISMENGMISAEASPCRQIKFVADTMNGGFFSAEKGKTITRAEHKLNGAEKYVRVECVDEDGNKAWSNPVYFDKE